MGPASGGSVGEGQRNLLFHLAGNRSRSLLPISGARLPSRRLGLGFGISLRKRRGTSLVGPERLFQLLPQSLHLCQRLLQLPLQRLHLPFEFLFPIRGATVIGRLHPFDNDINIKICPAPCLNTLCLLSCPRGNTLAEKSTPMVRKRTLRRAVIVPVTETLISCVGILL